MKRTIALLLSLLLCGIFPSAFATEGMTMADGVYSETLLALPEGMTSIIAMDVAPDDSIYAVASQAEGGYTLLRYTGADAAPESFPLVLEDAEVASIAIAPDGQILMELAVTMEGMEQLMQTMTGQSGESGADAEAEGAQDAEATADADASAGEEVPAGEEPAPEAEGETPAQENKSVQTVDFQRMMDNASSTLCWLDQTGKEVARFELSGYMQSFIPLSGQRVASIDSEQGVILYDAEGIEITRIQAFGGINVAATESTLYVVAMEAVEEWSIETGEKLRSIPMEASYSSLLSTTTDGGLTLADTQGVYQIAAKEDTVTHIMSTLGTLMGDPGNGILSFAARSNGTFAALVMESAMGGMGMGGGAGRSVMRMGSLSGMGDVETSLALYQRLEGITAADRKPFVITSLYDHTRLRKAATEFQRANPDLAVELRILIDGMSRNADTLEDHIRTLNTELLAGGGGDVIILDDLPIENYAKKGVLTDLSALLPELSLLPGIAEGSLSEDGKAYALPAQFTFQTLWGRKEAIDTISTLADLPYVPLGADQVPLSARTPEELIRLFYPASEPAFRDPTTGKVNFNAPEFADFLETLYTIYSEQDEMPDRAFGRRRGGMAGINAEELLALNNGNVVLCPFPMGSLLQIDLIYSLAGGTESSHVVLPSITGDGFAYSPEVLAGVSAQSQNTEKGLDFVRQLFTDDVQKSDQMNALPTTVAALDSQFQDAKDRLDEDNMTVVSMRIPGGATLMMTQANEALLSDLRARCDTLNTPILTDETLLSFIIEETQRFFEGTGGAAEAAQGIESRAWLYQNE